MISLLTNIVKNEPGLKKDIVKLVIVVVQIMIVLILNVQMVPVRMMLICIVRWEIG